MRWAGEILGFGFQAREGRWAGICSTMPVSLGPSKAWLRRRRKTIVPTVYKKVRVAFAKWVLRRLLSTLVRWVYSDGTTFFLARGWNELESHQRAALGTHVWRMADGSDGLYEDCVGPSAYYKAQGTPVKIWGLLLNGTLRVSVLPAGENMTSDNYVSMIDKRFRKWIDQEFWRGAEVFLVQDHERCLHTEDSKEAMKRQGIQLLEFPKSSQDLNKIEQAWRELKARLRETAPANFEKRGAFVARVHRAVAWVNKNRADLLLELCQSQKESAQEVLDLKGARTSG